MLTTIKYARFVLIESSLSTWSTWYVIYIVKYVRGITIGFTVTVDGTVNKAVKMLRQYSRTSCTLGL
jgi:hypothetical protein